LGITYNGSEGLILSAYSDADHGAGEDRKSIPGYLFKIAGGAVAWMSKKQPTIALSSTEAGYMGLLQAVKQLIWTQRFLWELGREAKNDTIVYKENQVAIVLGYNPEFHARTKHIDIQYHFIRECIENERLTLEYCATEDLIADGLTKALPKERHCRLLGEMGLRECNSITKR
jgi:hypothetical protein